MLAAVPHAVHIMHCNCLLPQYLIKYYTYIYLAADYYNVNAAMHLANFGRKYQMVAELQEPYEMNMFYW